MVEAGVGSVEYAEAVSSWFDLEKRHHLAVDAVHVTVEFLNPDGMLRRTVDYLRIVKRAVAVKKTVLQHQGDFELALREVQRLLGFVAYQIEAGETGVDVKSCDAKGVIVVPKCRGRLAIRVGRWMRIELGAVFAVRGKPCFGIAVVVRHGACTVKVSYVADRRIVSILRHGSSDR